MPLHLRRLQFQHQSSAVRSVSVVNMIMATGLAVDYSVYFAQKFMVTSGATRTERVQKAMSHTGYAVFLGGFTALIGTIPLAFASSKVWP